MDRFEAYARCIMALIRAGGCPIVRTDYQVVTLKDIAPRRTVTLQTGYRRQKPRSPHVIGLVLGDALKPVDDGIDPLDMTVRRLKKLSAELGRRRMPSGAPFVLAPVLREVPFGSEDGTLTFEWAVNLPGDVLLAVIVINVTEGTYRYEYIWPAEGDRLATFAELGKAPSDLKLSAGPVREENGHRYVDVQADWSGEEPTEGAVEFLKGKGGAYADPPFVALVRDVPSVFRVVNTDAGDSKVEIRVATDNSQHADLAIPFPARSATAA